MKKTLSALLLVLVLALAACAGQEEPTPTAVPVAPTEEAAATASEPTTLPPTSVPEATAEPTAPGDYIDSLEHTPDPQLVDITWQWLERADASGTAALTVPDPQNYTLIFYEDGTFNAQLDCNNGNGRYATQGGGSIFMELGPTTMAACRDDSLAVAMANLFGPAQSYRFEDDGQTLIFSWAADGGTDTFRNAAAAPDAPDETAIKAIPTDAITLNTEGLADSYSWQVMEGSPIPPGPGGQGYPDYVLLTFDGESPEDAVLNNGPRMYIFPKQAYLDLYASAGSTSVATQVSRLEELIAGAEGRTTPPEGFMPLLPPPSSLMDRWVQFQDLSFQVGTGVRYISDSPSRQSMGPWTDETTGYYYQGLSSDRVFYVSFFWPVATESLPDTADDVPADVAAQASDPGTNSLYQLDIKDTLNALPSSSWVPDLAQLDAMIASLSFPLSEATPAQPAEPVGDATATPTPAPAASGPTATVTAPDGIFVRSGPGTEYADIGVAATGQTSPIVGRSEDGQWWVIEVPLTWSPDQQGWVSAQFVEASPAAADVPVIAAPESTAPAPVLTGTTWQWLSLTDPADVTAVTDPTRYTIRFNSDGSAAIKADCNNVGATYTTDSTAINIVPGPSTRAACPADSLDQQFLTSLSSAAIYFFQDGDLLLDLAADAGTMRFSSGTAAAPAATATPTPAGEPNSPNGGATGILFRVVSFGPPGGEQSLIEGTNITATFSNTDVVGSAGCNDYSGRLTPVDDYFTIGAIAVTEKACLEPAGIMEQEQAYLAALQGTNGFDWATQPTDAGVIITAGQLSYVLPDGTSGVINLVAQ